MLCLHLSSPRHPWGVVPVIFVVFFNVSVLLQIAFIAGVTGTTGNRPKTGATGTTGKRHKAGVTGTTWDRPNRCPLQWSGRCPLQWFGQCPLQWFPQCPCSLWLVPVVLFLLELLHETGNGHHLTGTGLSTVTGTGQSPRMSTMTAGVTGTTGHRPKASVTGTTGNRPKASVTGTTGHRLKAGVMGTIGHRPT